MSLLSYSAITDYPFQPFTKIYSADINLMFSTIQTLVNGSLDGTTNIKAQSLVRYGVSSNLVAGTANYVVYNDSSGNLTEAAFLPTTLGGLGANLTPSSSLQAGQPLVVNSAGTGFTISASGVSSSNIFNYYNLG